MSRTAAKVLLLAPLRPVEESTWRCWRIDHNRVARSLYLIDRPWYTITMSEALLFENTFVIETINSQKYDRVSRISAYSEDRATFLMLDVNTELFPLSETDRVKVALALTLNLDGSKDDTKGWREVGMGEQTLANEYDYVCHGKIYRFEEGQGDNM